MYCKEKKLNVKKKRI